MKRFLLIGAPLAAAAFAVWPVRQAKVQTPAIERAELRTKQIVGVDLAAFRVPIWVAEPLPPPPSPPAPAPAPPPPLKLQLLAIISEAEGYKAAVYDPDRDRILVVSAGEKLGIRTVEHVDKATMTIRDDTGKRVLALKESGAP
jgi:hypothetical protein